jgi:hypothetical protein
MAAAKKRGITADDAHRLVGILLAEKMLIDGGNGPVRLTNEGAKWVEVARSFSPTESDKQEFHSEEPRPSRMEGDSFRERTRG